MGEEKGIADVEEVEEHETHNQLQRPGGRLNALLQEVGSGSSRDERRRAIDFIQKHRRCDVAFTEGSSSLSYMHSIKFAVRRVKGDNGVNCALLR